jgi:glycosyltransferase involved in cell wall biosynthesis
VLSVIVPVFNEEEVLPQFFARLRPALDESGTNYEVLVVNDGSSDDSGRFLTDAAASWPALQVLTLRHNAGHQAALTAGLQHATGDWVVTIDADLQDPPELIPTLLTAATQGNSDVVYAVRSDRKRDSFFKRITAKGYYRLMTRLAGSNVPQQAGDFRLMSRRVVDELNALLERHRVYRLLVPYLSFDSTIVKYPREPRAAGATKYSLRRMLGLAFDSATSFSATPLRLATWLGLAGSIFSALLAIATIAAWAFGATVPGWTSVMVAVFFVGAIQLICLGLLGEYMARVFAELQRRPQYLLEASDD